MLDDPLKMAKLLRRRLDGEPFPYSFIREADPYSAAPEDLVRGAPGTDPGQGKGVAWFCCPPKCHESAGGESPSKRKRKVAAAGETYWHAEAGKKPILGAPMGAYKRALSYVKNVKNPPGMPTTFTRKRLGWCMLEIGLHGADQQLVLCKLYKSPRPPTDPETSREASLPGGGIPLPEPPGPAPLVAEFPISRVAIVRNGSAAAAAGVTVLIDLCGSSIPPAAQRMKDMANIVRSMENPVVVLSAMGITTATILLAAWKALRCGAEKVCEIQELLYIKEMHLRTVKELGLETSSVSGSLDELEHRLQRVARTKELTPWSRDYLVSFGESTSTKIFSKYLSKLEGRLQVWKLRAIATSGRGSSDLTATTIDRALESREIQVWKDVDGVFSCDPKVCADATLVPHLTFDEATDLSDLAEQSMKQAMEYGISVRVRNPYKPQVPGTVITKTRDMSESTLSSIVLKSNITMLDIKTKRMLGQTDFVTTAFSKFQHFEFLGISVDYKVTTEGKMSLTLVPSSLLSQELIKMVLDNVVEELQKIADVHRLENVSVISLIGNARRSSSIQEKALSVLRNINAEVHKFSQESSKVVMKAFLVVEKSRAKDCVQALHSAFFEKGLVSEDEGAENVPQVPVYSPAVAASSSDVEGREPPAPPCGGLEWQGTYSGIPEFIDGPLLSFDDKDKIIDDDVNEYAWAYGILWDVVVGSARVNLDIEDGTAEEVATSRKRSRADDRVESSSSVQVAVTKKSKPVGRWNLLGLSSKNPVPVRSDDTSPAAATKEEEAVNSPGADHPKDFTEPQDPFLGSPSAGDDLFVRDSRKAKAPAAQPQGQTIGPFLLTQESEAFREDPAVKGLLDGVTAYFHLKGECERQKERASEARKLHHEAAEQRDAAKNRVLDLERQLSSAKRTLQDKEEELAAAAVRDDQLGGRLISAAEGLSSLGVRSERTGEVRVDALSDAVTQIEGQSSLVADLGIKAATLLKRMRTLMYPEEKTPESLEGLVAAFGDDEDPLGDYSRAQSTSGAEAAIAMAMASGIRGNFDVAFSGPPKDSRGREVDLASFGEEASRLAAILSGTMERMLQEAIAAQEAAKAKSAASS